MAYEVDPYIIGVVFVIPILKKDSSGNSRSRSDIFYRSRHRAEND